jgi:NADPH-dependent 2,4-dienoyl-CoA reductase/sulfur reductase-like enzyme/peroxiredoxin family protein/TusA-related sulfurtransferase/rhodanese-related sulfurtransferase
MKRVVVVGGVAGGATAAARIKRLDSSTQVTMFERSPDISFANCGLPYYLGREITDRSRLALHTPQSFAKAVGVDVKVETTVTAIDAANKVVLYRANGSTEEKSMAFDKLVYSPGANPLRPSCIPGINDPRIVTLRNLQDMDLMDHILQLPSTRRVVVVGAGFIGLEVVEQLVHLKKKVHLVEMSPAVLPQADIHMSEFLHQPLASNGVTLHLGDGVKSFACSPSGVSVQLCSGAAVEEADVVVLCIGVSPSSELAASAGLAMGHAGRVQVNSFMQTSHPDIYSVGDVVETADLVFPERKAWTALGNVANMQARIAADHLTRGTSIPYKGSLGTAIVRVFDHVLAVTGWTERRLANAGIPFATSIVTQDNHAGYYPGATPISMTLTYDPATGRLFGAQAVGFDGVDKRIDVVATAIQGGLTVDDLSQTQLSYSPPFGSARDVVNTVALVSRNGRDGLSKTTRSMKPEDGKVLVDVRPPELAALSPVLDALNIPFAQIASGEGVRGLDKAKRYTTICAVGKTSYFAGRILAQQGFDVASLSGGLKVHRKPEPVTNVAAEPPVVPSDGYQHHHSVKKGLEVVNLDCTGLACPGPLMKLKACVEKLPAGTTLRVTASDSGFANDIKAFAKSNALEVISVTSKGGIVHGELVVGDGGAPQHAAGGATGPRKGASIVVFSQDMDKVLASLVIANGARAMGGEVTMFFTFWGLNALRKPDGRSLKSKGFMDNMFGMMMPKGLGKLPISNMNFAGIGPKLLRRQMGAKSLPTVDGLLRDAQLQKVRIVACTMSMDAMGITKEELLDGIEYGGVADFMASSERTGTNLFI